MAELPKKKAPPPLKAKLPKEKRPMGKIKDLVGRPDLTAKMKSTKYAKGGMVKGGKCPKCGKATPCMACGGMTKGKK